MRIVQEAIDKSNLLLALPRTFSSKQICEAYYKARSAEWETPVDKAKKDQEMHTGNSPAPMPITFHKEYEQIDVKSRRSNVANNVFLCCLHLVTAVICSGCVYEQRPTVEKHIQMMRCSSARLKRLGCWGLHRLSVTIKNVSNRELLISRSFMSIVTYPDQGLHENERMHHENLSCFSMNGEDFAELLQIVENQGHATSVFYNRSGSWCSG